MWFLCQCNLEWLVRGLRLALLLSTVLHPNNDPGIWVRTATQVCLSWLLPPQFVTIGPKLAILPDFLHTSYFWACRAQAFLGPKLRLVDYIIKYIKYGFLLINPIVKHNIWNDIWYCLIKVESLGFWGGLGFSMHYTEHNFKPLFWAQKRT